MLRRLPCRAIDPADPSFNLQLQIHRACLVSAEAEFEGMLQMLQSKTIRTSLVGSIQKRAIGDGFGHSRLEATRTQNHRRYRALGVRAGQL
jgi:hypothetical protein